MLDALGVDTRDLVGVVLAATSVGVVVTGFLAVMLAIISLKLLFSFSMFMALLMASSKVASMSSSSSISDSSSIKIFSLPLL